MVTEPVASGVALPGWGLGATIGIAQVLVGQCSGEIEMAGALHFNSFAVHPLGRSLRLG